MRPKLGDLLVAAGVLTPEGLATALAAQREDRVKRRLGEIVVDLGLASEGRLLEVLSRALAIPVVDLENERPTAEAVVLLGRDDALKWLMLPLRIDRSGSRRVLVVVMADPANLESIDLVQFTVGMPVRAVLSTTRQVRRAIQDAYGLQVSAAPHRAVDLEATWVGRPRPAAGHAEALAVELRVHGGPRDGARIPVPPGRTLVIGRAPEADVVINDMYLSRRHFQLTNTGRSVELVDLGSSNGTLVNGKALATGVVYDGDRVELGRTVIVISAPFVPRAR